MSISVESPKDIKLNDLDIVTNKGETIYNNKLTSLSEVGDSLCKICSDIANTHSHYGAISCTSCRAFFRRAVTTKADFQCIFSTNECLVTKSTRKRCQACRLKKCFIVGMNPGWIMGERKRNGDDSAQEVVILSDQEDTDSASVVPRPHLERRQQNFINNGSAQFEVMHCPPLVAEDDYSSHSNSSNSSLSNNRSSSCSSHHSLISDADIEQPKTYAEGVLIYSKLVARVIKFAKGFQEFWNISDIDQRCLLLHNCDPLIQLCTSRGFAPPWCDRIYPEPGSTPEIADAHLELRNEIQRMGGDAKTRLLIAFMALFSSQFCTLENLSLVQRTRDYSQGLLRLHLIEVHGETMGEKRFADWCRILLSLHTLAQQAMTQKLIIIH